MKASNNRPKAANVFTNDGSFLERFQRSKKVRFNSYVLPTNLTGRPHFQEEEEKQRLEEDAMRLMLFYDWPLFSSNLITAGNEILKIVS